MKHGDMIRVDLPGNVYVVGEYRNTNMFGDIECFCQGYVGAFIDTQIQSVARYYLKTDKGVTFTVDSLRVIPLGSNTRSGTNDKCECGSEAVGSSRHSYYCAKKEATP